MFRFIHTSDLHIGRHFNYISLHDEQAHMLDQILAYCEQNRVDALIIAGDVYDNSTPAREALALFESFLDRCRDELNIPVVLISGNHDCPVRLGMNKKAVRRAGLYLLTDLKDVTQPVILGDDEPVYFYGIPFCDPISVRAATGDSVKTYDEAHTLLVEQVKAAHTSNSPKVLLSHCFVQGGKVTDSERTLSVGGSDQVSAEPMMDFDYVALGHLHSAHHKGAEHIRYCGSPLKYSLSEANHDKSVTLVTLSQGESQYDLLPISPLRDVRIIKNTFEDILKDAPSDPNPDDFIRIELTDVKRAHNPLSRLREYYPNIVELRNTGLEQSKLSTGHAQSQVANIKQRSAQDIVQDFYTSEGLSNMDDTQTQLLNNVINSVSSGNIDDAKEMAHTENTEDLV